MATNRFPTPCVEWIPDCQLPMLRNPSYQWAHILDKTLLGIPALRLQPIRGVIFSGPPGNGRHTTAEAVAGTLRALPTNPRYCLRISACTLDTEEVADACAVIDNVNAALRKHGRICLLVDHPEHSRHSMAIQEYLYQLLLAWNDSLFLILITEDVSSICANLQRKLTLCHCPRPDQSTRQKWIEGILKGDPDKKIAPINIIGCNHMTIARETKDFSWKQMADLRSMMLRSIACKYLNNQDTYNPNQIPGYEVQLWRNGKIQLSKSDVMEIIVQIRSQSAPAPVAGAVQVLAAPGGAIPAKGAAAFGEDASEAAQDSGPKKKPEEMSFAELTAGIADL